MHITSTMGSKYKQYTRAVKRTGTALLVAGVFASPLAFTGAVGAAPVFTEYPIPTQNANGADATTGPDGAMWFSERGVGKIGRTTTAGVTTEYTIPSPHSSPVGITTGPDGAVWFAESDGGNVGRITTGGTFTEYPLPSGASPTDVVTGPDGNIWFSTWTWGAGKVDISTGTVTEYSARTGSNAPQMRAITTGPDGALWATEESQNSLDRFDTSGNLTRYPITNGMVNAADIITGPDGALWFTSSSGGSIGRFDMTTHAQTSFTTDEPYYIPEMTIGTDGALWFTEVGANKLGRLTTAGAYSSYSVPSRTSPYGITVGSDNALWYTQYGGDKVGRALVNHAPIVNITNPGANSTVSGTVNITGTINSNSPYNVQLYVFNSAGQSVAAKYQYAVPDSTTGYGYSWDTTAVPNGNYTVYLSARDAQGNKDAGSTSTVHVTVQN